MIQYLYTGAYELSTPIPPSPNIGDKDARSPFEVHAKVYFIADDYDISKLRVAAAKHLEACFHADSDWNRQVFWGCLVYIHEDSYYNDDSRMLCSKALKLAVIYAKELVDLGDTDDSSESQVCQDLFKAYIKLKKPDVETITENAAGA